MSSAKNILRVLWDTCPTFRCAAVLLFSSLNKKVIFDIEISVKQSWCITHTHYRVVWGTGWRIVAAYAQRKVFKQRGAAVRSSTDRNRRTFSSTDAPDTEQRIQGASRRTEAVLKEKAVEIQHSTSNVFLVNNKKHVITSHHTLQSENMECIIPYLSITTIFLYPWTMHFYCLNLF